MLELLVALVILVMAFSVIWSSFSATLRGWERGSALLDELHRGDFVMEQLVSALRSTAFFPASAGYYGFWLDAGGGSPPKDEISWVTSGSALLPTGSELANGLYRVKVTVEDDEDGNPSVAVRAFPHMSDEDDYDTKTWYISSAVKGLSCRVYNFEDEAWQERWEDTNAIPSLVELSLYMDPIKSYGPPVVLQRLVEIPMGPAVTNAVLNEEAPVDDEAGTEAQTPAAAAGNQQNPGGPQ